MALGLLTGSEHRKGKMLHRVPQPELAHVWRKQPLGTCPIGYMIHVASELNPKILFPCRENLSKVRGSCAGGRSLLPCKDTSSVLVSVVDIAQQSQQRAVQTSCIFLAHRLWIRLLVGAGKHGVELDLGSLWCR